MPWTDTTRGNYCRRDLRYASDCRDEEWALIAPFLRPRSAVGRPREVEMRDVWDAIQYMASAGCPWRLLPSDFPPVSTVQYHFYRLRDSGVLDVIMKHWSWRRVSWMAGVPSRRQALSTVKV